MSFKVDISWEQIQEFVDEIVWKYTDKHLSDVEVQVLKGSWEGKRYEDIATELHLTTTYIQNDVGAKLWKKLTDIIGEPVSKSNFRQALYREREKLKTPLFTMAIAPAIFNAPAQAETKTFNRPRTRSVDLDWCLTWDANCGEPAAKAFC